MAVSAAGLERTADTAGGQSTGNRAAANEAVWVVERTVAFLALFPESVSADRPQAVGQTVLETAPESGARDRSGHELGGERGPLANRRPVADCSHHTALSAQRTDRVSSVVSKTQVVAQFVAAMVPKPAALCLLL